MGACERYNRCRCFPTMRFTIAWEHNVLPYGIACSNRLIRCAEVVPQGTFSCPNRQFTLSHPTAEHSSLDKTRRCRPQSPDERVAQYCYPPVDLLLPFGQFTLCPPPQVRRTSQPSGLHPFRNLQRIDKISKADRNTHRLRKKYQPFC